MQVTFGWVKINLIIASRLDKRYDLQPDGLKLQGSPDERVRV